MEAPAHMTVPPRVADAIRAGEFWRAKEQMAGRLASPPYSAAEHELYGWILLQMGDKMEAGRHLWCACTERPEYTEAIGLFLQRHGQKPWSEFARELPSRVRTALPSQLPPELMARLQEKGARWGNPSADTAPANGLHSLGCWLMGAIALVILVLMAISCALGVPLLIERVFGGSQP